MEWLIILVLGVVIVALWDRVRILERRVETVEQREYAPAPQATDDGPVYVAPQEEEAPEAGPIATAEPAMARTAPREEVLEQEIAAPVAETALENSDASANAEVEADQDRFQLPRLDLEDLFGRRLPIWLGGIALAVGGIFLVRYSIERGLLGPQVRVALSFLFGLLLLAGAEAAYRFEERVADPRVRQALAGAGIATLYAAFYLAGAQYGLIGPGVAFAGLALVTAAALGLTYRFGLPTAVLGLVGGFATPMMVASDEANVPILAFYLALLTAGLALTARRLGQRWLGGAALVGGFFWGTLMIIGGSLDSPDLFAVGLYLLALGAAIPLILPREMDFPVTRVVSGAIAVVQLAALIAIAGFDLLTWGLYLLLGAALAILSWQLEQLRIASAVALALGVVMLLAWPEPSLQEFAIVTTGLAIIGLGTPLALLWKDRASTLEVSQVALGALGLGFACHFHFGSSNNDIFVPGLAAAFCFLLAPVAFAAWLLWNRKDALTKLLALPVAAVATLAFGAAHVLLPDWAEVIGASAVTLPVLGLVRLRRTEPLVAVAWIGALVVLATLFSTGEFLDELGEAVEDNLYRGSLSQALIRWGVAALAFAALAWTEWRRAGLRVAEIVLGLLTYVLLAQIVPETMLAWMAAIASVALIWFLPPRRALWGTFITLAFLWSLLSVVPWLDHGLKALGGIPMLATDLVSVGDLLRQALPVALAAAFGWWRMGEHPRARRLLAGIALAAGIVVDHTLFKQVFALASVEDFVAHGMAERTVWQALLVAAGIALLRWLPEWRQLGVLLLAAGLAHFATFTFALHNPLWDAQHVGALPIANWLAPAYAIAVAGVWWLVRQNDTVNQQRLRALGDGMIMLLISFWALSELRHAFAGSLLTSTPMTQGEDLLRSLLGIVLALGFLWWGSRKQQRSWRIGSLVLIVLAILKVGLFDVAGLDDLLRVASFIALGFSLIGIGWFYTRQLRTQKPEVAA